MRRSLGGGGGRGMGGGGGGMVRTFQRAIKAGAGGAPSNTIGSAKTGKANKLNKKRPTSPNTALTLSSPSFSTTVNLPTTAVSAPAWISSSSTDESEWEYVPRIEDETAARVFYDDYVFETVPSTDEVHRAVSALQQALGSSSPTANLVDSEIDWFEPSHNLYSSKELQRPSTDVVNNAFHLLESEPSVQRMVVSLSSDKAVWDAVMNNEVVKELRGSTNRVASLVAESSNNPDGDDNSLSWVVKFAKAKIIQLMDLITKLVGNIFQRDKKGDDGLDGKVKSSLFLSIMVLLVVILARTKTSNA